MSDTDQNARAEVVAIVARAEIPVTDDEFAHLVKIYPLVKASRASLYVPEVRYGEPATIYRAL